MASLLDIAPVPDVVDVNGNKVEVFGVSVLGIATLWKRYPELRNLFDTALRADTLLNMGPHVAAAFIAAGCGHPGDEKAEQIALSLDASAQVDLLQAIWRRTMPKDVRPFVESLAKLTEATRPATSMVDRLKEAQKSNSQKPSKPLSDAATIQPASGA